MRSETDTTDHAAPSSNANPLHGRGRHGDLTSGPVQGHLVRLSVPMIWGILAIVASQLVNTFYISMISPAHLAAISFTFPVTMTVLSLIIGLGIGMSSVVSRAIGEGNHDTVVRLSSHGLILAVIAGVIMALAGHAIMDPLFRAMGATDDMMPMVLDYMGLWFTGIVFITVPMVGNSAIRATGDTLTPALIMMGTTAFLVVLDPLLIFGLFGLPRMEMHGAALATIISYGLSMIVALWILKYKKRIIFQDGLHLDQFGDSARRLLFIALPAGITSTIQPMTSGVLTAILAQSGTHAVAAFGVATRVEAFAFIVIMALATGMSPILGQNWGARRFDRVHETLRLAIRFCVLWSVAVAAILMIGAYPLAGLFSTDAETVRMTALYFLIVPFSYAAGNLVPGWSSAFNAIGLPQRSAAMIGVKMIIVQIPLAFIGNHFFGVIGVFASIAIANIGTGLYYHWRNKQHMTTAELAHSPA